MQYSSYTNMRFVISFRPQKRESDVMTILKYFEPTIAVAQLQIKLNKKEIFEARTFSHLLRFFHSYLIYFYSY